ncbi:MAG TPA: hypothetical protein VGZ91_16065 [Candidatus Sulfotelmatobacter sp.]|nr:hypothetical protein [Candidatus Sulfotelmatobacter sp.]
MKPNKRVPANQQSLSLELSSVAAAHRMRAAIVGIAAAGALVVIVLYVLVVIFSGIYQA